MSSFMSYFGGRRDPKASARDAIVGLRQQLQLIEKKEEYLQRQIEAETKKARANAVSNKQGELYIHVSCITLPSTCLFLTISASVSNKPYKLTDSVLLFSRNCSTT